MATPVRKLKITNANGSIHYVPKANLKGLQKKNHFAKEKDKFKIEEVELTKVKRKQVERLIKVHEESAASKIQQVLKDKDAEIEDLKKQLAEKKKSTAK